MCNLSTSAVLTTVCILWWCLLCCIHVRNSTYEQSVWKCDVCCFCLLSAPTGITCRVHVVVLKVKQSQWPPPPAPTFVAVSRVRTWRTSEGSVWSIPHICAEQQQNRWVVWISVVYQNLVPSWVSSGADGTRSRLRWDWTSLRLCRALRWRVVKWCCRNKLKQLSVLLPNEWSIKPV